ncbi:hypothetical protein Bfae_03660 [Brachybacterium faecium DSM 4810]|uniref:Lipoprotein n=1 Tax=Brachybacterium faecium (strain ATCC 43885 / DSM 4810 / JCM 11609 / LMG 19847 / NBRC 14762 / NCIMB 9860 / 6-10) TaxID=446465 RepID=C7MGQ0_BRAFD|nr:hypothetical protein [Brachybacterium faecium]ACU84241.1 hypothetical protein Bfae_03660 [Brachybacterium faecium DSM 4810]
MSARPRPVRPAVARVAGALLAVSLLATGCSESDPAPEESSAPAASDGGASEDGGASDAGGSSSAGVPQDPYPATPAPEGFEVPDPCSGEGAYFVDVGGTASPELPERAGESLTIEAVGIEGEDAQLTATLGDGSARPIEGLTLGETATVDLWTISVTSVCEDSQQIEFDLID